MGIEATFCGSGDPEEADRILAWAAAVEGESKHPLAQAVVKEGRSRGVETLAVEDGTLSQVHTHCPAVLLHMIANVE